MSRTQSQLNSLLDGFIRQYTGQKPGYNGYAGQCLSLVKLWVDVVAGGKVAPSAGGYGDYYYSRFPAPLASYFKQVAWSPTTTYPRGSLITYPSTHHIAIVNGDGTSTTTNVFEQNADGDASSSHLYNRANSKGVGGVLVPITSSEASTLPPSGSRIQLIPTQTRTTYHAGTSNVAGHINVTNDGFIYVIRGYDSKYPGRVLINSASGGGDGVSLALYYLSGARIAGWKTL